MAYVKIKDSGLKDLKVSFISEKVNVTKTVREDRIERFRQDILMVHGLLFIRYPHVIKIEY